MRPLVKQVVIVLVLGFLFQELKTNEVSLTQTCKINFTSANCFYNGTSTFDGFKWYTNREHCGTYSPLANGTCLPFGRKICTGFTHTCPKSNTSTMTAYDTMLYSEDQPNLTCQPIQTTSTNERKLNSQTLHLTGGNDSTSINILPYIAAGGCLLILVIVVMLTVKLCHCQKEEKSVPEPRRPPLPRKSVDPHYNIIIDSETNPLTNNVSDTNLNQAVPGTSTPYPSTSSQSHILKNGVEYAVVNKKGKGKGKSMGSQQKLSVNTDEDTLNYVELSFNEKKDDKFQYVNHVHGRAESVAYAEVK